MSSPAPPAGLTTPPPLLTVEGLTVRFRGDGRPVQAVNDVSFAVAAGERVGIVGESGAGKSVTAMALLGLLASPPATVTGRASFGSADLLTMGPRQLRSVRGRRIAMIFQDPVTSLNPRLTVGQHLVEGIRAHERVSRKAARARGIDLLRRVEIPAPDRRIDEYPHRLSGGMAQRVMIAIAVSCGPELILADEPTTALDVTIEAQIVDLLTELAEERGTAVVFITHDLALLARFADRIIVMYGGRVVEEGAAATIYRDAAHPYTNGLMNAVIRPGRARATRLATIPGDSPSPADLPSGCAFHPRCAHALDRCREELPSLDRRSETDSHRCACHLVTRPWIGDPEAIAATPVVLKDRRVGTLDR